MVSFRWVRVFALTVILALSQSSLHAQQTASDFLKISLNALKYNDYNNVLFFANKSLALNPAYGAAYWNRAIAYDNLDSFQKSLADYRKAISLYEDSADIATLHKNMGMVYNDMHQYDSAIAEFNIALQMKPDYGLAYWNRGLAYDNSAKNSQAIRDYTKALSYFTSISDRSELLILRGLQYYYIKDAVKAQADLKKVLDMDTTPTYHTAFASFLLINKDSAKSVIRRFIIKARSNTAKPQEYANAYFDAACLFSMMSNKEKAMGCLEMSLDLGYKNFHNINVDRDLDNIRTDPGFADLVAKYRDKKKQ